MSWGKRQLLSMGWDPYMSKSPGWSQGLELGGNLSSPAVSFLPLLIAFDLNAIENWTFWEVISECGKTTLLDHSHSSGGRYDHSHCEPPLLDLEFSPLKTWKIADAHLNEGGRPNLERISPQHWAAPNKNSSPERWSVRQAIHVFPLYQGCYPPLSPHSEGGTHSTIRH